MTRQARRRFTIREAAAATWSAKWELVLPVVIIVSLLAGATTVQSAALAALFTLDRAAVHPARPRGFCRNAACDEPFDRAGRRHSDHSRGRRRIHDVSDRRAGARRLADWARENIHSKWMFLLGLNAFLIIVGGLMDIFSSIIVVVPLVVPIATHFQVDPIHLGIIFVANSELGYLTPPVGENLFVASYRFNKPILELARAMLPMYVILLIGVLLITYLPWLTTGLSR